MKRSWRAALFGLAALVAGSPDASAGAGDEGALPLQSPEATGGRRAGAAQGPAPPAGWGRADAEPGAQRRDPMALQVGVDLGLAARLDQPPLWTPTESAGLLLGAQLGLRLGPELALAVAYEHLGLGEQKSEVGLTGAATVSRALDSAWLGLRTYPLRAGPVGAFLHIGLGAAWQRAELSAVAWLPEQPSTAQPFACHGSTSPGPGLRAAAGIETELSRPLRALGAVGLDVYRLDDDIMDGCVPGSGSASLLTVRIGLSYDVDLGS
ncbi:MAG: hypothetical protein HY744_16030 [Deltaproteobacteria bacterium]|nr:hypothetical protein [Deltaproteobacteria bacterium]